MSEEDVTTLRSCMFLDASGSDDILCVGETENKNIVISFGDTKDNALEFIAPIIMNKEEAYSLAMVLLIFADPCWTGDVAEA